jgi:hypothetical protein
MVLISIAVTTIGIEKPRITAIPRRSRIQIGFQVPVRRRIPIDASASWGMGYEADIESATLAPEFRGVAA